MKGIISKLFTAARGAATEVGEGIVDANAERILDQEMREATEELDRAKGSLATLMGERTGVARQVDALRANIAEYEETAMSAMDKGNDGLATRVADRIGELEQDLSAKEDALRQYDESIRNTRQAIRTSENSLSTLRRQVSVVKATERAQQVSASVAARYSGTSSKMGSAKESLKRIQERQQKRADTMAAAEQLADEESGGDLDREIREFERKGGGRSGSAVLDRLRARKAATETEGAE